MRASIAMGLLLAVACGQGPVLTGSPVPGFRARDVVDVTAPDAIRPLERPAATPIGSVRPPWLDASTPVLVVRAVPTRAYPVPVLLRHQVINEIAAGDRVLVTYCPLTGAARAFTTDADDRFGTSGKWYRSNLVLYDRRTRSLWEQMTGRALLGPRKGAVLSALPSSVVPFAEFVRHQPRGEVVLGDARIDYGRSPLAGYASRTVPLRDLYDGRIDARLDPMRRVVGVRLDGVARAYDEDALARAGDLAVVNDRLGPTPVALFWRRSARGVTAAPVIADASLVGAAGVFVPVVRGRFLRFEARGDAIVDRETGSTWSLLGRALTGPLAGRELPAVDHVTAHWFAWAGIEPATTLWGE